MSRHNIKKKNHIHSRGADISKIVIFIRNLERYPWQQMPSVAFLEVTGSLSSFSRKCLPNTQAWITIICPSVILASKYGVSWKKLQLVQHTTQLHSGFTGDQRCLVICAVRDVIEFNKMNTSLRFHWGPFREKPAFSFTVGEWRWWIQGELGETGNTAFGGAQAPAASPTAGLASSVQMSTPWRRQTTSY